MPFIDRIVPALPGPSNNGAPNTIAYSDFMDKLRVVMLERSSSKNDLVNTIVALHFRLCAR